MYMFTRLTVNVPQVYLPKYLTKGLAMKKESIAFFPLMMLICSVVGELIQSENWPDPNSHFIKKTEPWSRSERVVLSADKVDLALFRVTLPQVIMIGK